MSNQTRVLMKLGGYTFGIDTAAFQSLTRTTKYRWAKHERPLKSPYLEWMGPGEDTVSLPGVVYPIHAGGLGQIDDMREIAGTGNPLLMVDGYGTVHGYWCISTITETRRAFLPGGAPQKIEFTLALIYYGASLSCV
jgi:hypothetical protein